MGIISVQELTGWLPTSAVARRLERSESWVRELADRGELRAVRTARMRLIDPASVDEYVIRGRPRRGGLR